MNHLVLRSWNVNGIRAAAEKGFADWFLQQDADIVALQEVKAFPDQIDAALRFRSGYESHFHPAEKPGYSGVAVWTRIKPVNVIRGLDAWDDREGRVLQVDFGPWVLINAYFPNSQREHTRLDFKLAFCEAMLRTCNAHRAAGRSVVVCGDFNIAHEEIDLRNPKTNTDNAGFLPEERAWMTRFLGAGYADTFREAHPGQGGHYTWWSYRPGVREKNIGWRLDYFCVDGASRDRCAEATIQDEVRGSDHCPVGLNYQSG